MAGPCVQDTDCIALSVDGSGKLIAQPIISGAAGNHVRCDPGGLFSGIDQTLFTSIAAPVSFLNFTIGSGEVTLQTASLTVTNLSATNPAKCMAWFDCGSMDVFNAQSLVQVSVNIYKRSYVGPPPAFALTRRFTMQNSSTVVDRAEDAGLCIPFGALLGAAGSITFEVQRRVRMNSAPSGSSKASVALGDIQAYGWVIG